MLGPIIEDRPPVKPDHIRHFPGKGPAPALREAAADEKTEQVEFGLAAHPLENVGVGKIIDPDDDPLAEGAEIVRQPRIGRFGKRLEIGKRRRQ